MTLHDMPKYLGDGVYVKYEDDYVTLWTENKGCIIFLDGAVWGNLQLWAKEKFGPQAFPPFSAGVKTQS